MTSATETSTILPDPVLERAGGLFERAGRDAVAGFIESRGWRVGLVKPVQALYRPTQSCLVRYNVRAHDAQDHLRVVSVCAETSAEPKSTHAVDDAWDRNYDFPGPIELRDDLLIWRFPYDPGLRGLQIAACGKEMRRALAREGHTPLGVSSQPISYRPRRRALFRYTALYGSRAPVRRATFYAKVMRTTRARDVMALADRLTSRRGLLRRPRPIPSLALPRLSAGRNIVLFDPVGGTALQDLLLHHRSLPRPERIVDLMDDISRLTPRDFSVRSHRHRRSVAETSSTAGELLYRIVPHCSPQIEFVLNGIARASQQDSVPRGVVHGDLYAAQVFVEDDFSLSLIDLDDFGIGDPALDAANFCAHLLALALSKPDAKSRLLAYRTLARETFMTRLELSPHDLDWRESFVMLQLATGPFRTLRPDWPRRVAQFLEVAHRLATSRAD
ncbi:MAG: phosphotransferase family protein [Actinomycetota bacterium]